MLTRKRTLVALAVLVQLLGGAGSAASPPAQPTAAAVASPATSRIGLGIRSGLGATHEADTGAVAQSFFVAADFEGRPTAHLRLVAHFGYHLYGRGYLLDRPDLVSGAGASRLTANENRYDLDLLVAYDVLRAWRGASLDLFLGPSFRLFRGEIDPTSVGGIRAGLGWRLPISGPLALMGSFSYNHNLFLRADDSLSLHGGPWAELAYGAGISIAFGPRARVGLGYEGESFLLERELRYFHRFVLALDVNL